MGVSIVILNDHMTEIEERCALTEEIYHYLYRAGNFVGPFVSYGDQLRAGKGERQALQWVASTLVPGDEFGELVPEGLSVEELADYFRVTPWLILAKFEFVKAANAEFMRWLETRR